MFAARAKNVKFYLKLLATQQGGAVAVEFAILAGFLITALVSILELGMIYLVSATLEGGIRDATRYGTTGQGATAAARTQHIVDVMNVDTLNMLHLTSANITAKVYQNFSSIGLPEPLTNDVNHNGRYDPGDGYTDVNGNGRYDLDQGTPGNGNAKDIVLYTVSYEWPLMFGTMFPFGVNGKITLSASQAIQNEPYAPI